MKEEQTTLIEKNEEEGELTVPIFGYELIREILLTDLLGQDAGPVMYWAGKRLARKFPLEDFQEISAFFISAGWGTLELAKEEKNACTFILSGEMVERRFAVDSAAQFRLEAGFLAEQLSQQKGCSAEAVDEPKRRAGRASILVMLDPKDPR